MPTPHGGSGSRDRGVFMATRFACTAAILAGCIGALAPAPATAGGFDGTWTHIPPTFAGAPTVTLATSFCDVARNRYIFFGGKNATGPLGTLWQRPLDFFSDFGRIGVYGPVPSPRHGHTMVYDSVRNRLLVFGGTTDGRSGINDLWELTLSGTPAWHQVVLPGGPSPRYGQVAIYDPVNDRMIVFSGSDGTHYFNDSWELDFAGTPHWSTLSIAGTRPLARYFAAAIYDPLGQRMVLFGGSALVSPPYPMSQNDVWTLALSGTPIWTRLAPPGVGPAPSSQVGSCYDPVRNRMLIFGGLGTTGLSNWMFALSLDASPAWTALGTFSKPRAGPCFAYDPTNDRVIIQGGEDSKGIRNDLWYVSFNPTPTASPGNPGDPGPLAGYGNQAVYDPPRNRAVLFGGFAQYETTFGMNRDLFAIPLNGQVDWTRLGVNFDSWPDDRALHLMLGDPVNDRMIVFGGQGFGQLFNDVRALDLTTNLWTQLAPVGAPPSPREAMAGVYDAARSRLMIFGGWDGHAALNDLWELDMLPVPTWRLVAVPDSLPPPRYYHSMVYDSRRNRIVLYGGTAGGSDLGDVWAFDLTGDPHWSHLTAAGAAPAPREEHAAIYDPLRDRMVVFGGYTGAIDNGTFALDFSGGVPTWSRLAPSGVLPSARELTSAFYDSAHDRMVVINGEPPSGLLPAGDTWSLSWSDLPTAALLSLVDYDAGPGRVTLRWQSADAAQLRTHVERSDDGYAWTTLGSPLLEGADLLVYDDVGVQPGRHQYRLAYANGSGEIFSDPVTVDVPAIALLSLDGLRPNPATRRSAIAFSLPDARPARLELIDVRGRIVLSREVGVLGSGSHSVSLSEAGRLGAGVYWVRLVRRGAVLTRKGVVLG